MRRSLYAILLAPLALAPWVPAAAQDPPALAPRILSVRDSATGEPRGGPGSFLHIAGEGFASERADVDVHSGAYALQVIAVEPDLITVAVPTRGVPPGVYALVVTVAGRRAQGDVPVEILDAAPSGAGDGSRPQLLRLDARTGSERGMSRIVVLGTVLDLPAGSVIDIEMQFFGHAVEVAQAEVQGGRFDAVFGPFDRPLAAGPFRLIARFDVTRQHRRVQALFAQAFPDPQEQRAREHLSAEAIAYCPDAATYETEMERQLQEAQLHYEQAVGRARRLLADLRDAFRAALKPAYRRPDGTFDEAAWRASTEPSYSTLPPTERAAKLDALLHDARFLDEAQRFAPAAWREWADEGFRADVIALGQEHQRFARRYVAPRHPDAAAHLDQALGLLLGFSQIWSTEVYVRNGLAPAPEDESPRGADLFPMPPTVTPQHFQALLDRVERDLAIGRHRAAAPATDGQAPPPR